MIRIMLVVTLLVCLLVVVLVITPYSKMAAVITWFLGSGLVRTVKYLKPLKKLNSPQIEKLDLLDTEYAAIIAASRNITGETLYNPAAVIKDLVSYRTATKQSVKDVLLCRLGNHLQLFTPQHKQEIAQQNKQLDDNGRLLLKEVVLERLGIML